MKRIILLGFIFFSVSLFAQSTPDDFLKKAIEHINEKEFDKALMNCNKAIVLDSNHVTAWYLKGYVNYRMMNFEEAILNLTRTIELDDEYLEAYYYRGLARNKTNKFIGAYRDLNKASDISPKDGRVIVLRGIVRAIVT